MIPTWDLDCSILRFFRWQKLIVKLNRTRMFNWIVNYYPQWRDANRRIRVEYTLRKLREDSRSVATFSIAPAEDGSDADIRTSSSGVRKGRERDHRERERERERDVGERRGLSHPREAHRQHRLYIFEQLVSRSFSSARLTLTRSVTPGPGTLQSQLSAIRMRVITRHSWLLRSTSVPAKFPRFEHTSHRRNFCRDERACTTASPRLASPFTT